MEQQQAVGPPTQRSPLMQALHKLYYVRLDQIEWGIVTGSFSLQF